VTQTKGERTRQRIVATVAPIFNQRGYAGTSLEDVMSASGLKKGGIYRHFESKDALALAAFDHSVMLQTERIRAYVAAAQTAEDRLNGLASALASVADDPPLPGGCPLLNTAIECDDAVGPAYARLRTRARRAMANLIAYAERLVADGIASGEFKSDTNAADEAQALVGALEGALMLAKLYDDPAYAYRAAARVALRTRTLLVPKARVRATSL
jgi:TetR/AcrR family transcriptional regulator, transcriptional repressor for nem operon